MCYSLNKPYPAHETSASTNPRPPAGEGARQCGRGATLETANAAPLPNPSDKTTKHLTRLTNYISQVIANPAHGRRAKTHLKPKTS
jgi:hypothetical protein